MTGENRRDWTAIIGVLLTAGSMFAGVVAYVVKLNEANDIKTEQIADIQREIEALKSGKVGEAVVRIETQMDGVVDDIKELKDDVREINGKLPRRR